MRTKKLADEVAAHAHGRVPRELRRRQVLTEARALFVQRGYHAASMDELARRMGVSKPVVYDLAGSKERLFAEVMAMVGEELTQTLTTAVLAEPDLTRRLHAGILAFLRYVGAHRAQWSALLTSLSTNDGPASAVLAELQRTQVLLVAQLIGQSGVDATLDPVVAEALAQSINGAVESTALWWKDHPELSPEALAELLTDFLSPGLLAISQRRSRPVAPPRRRARP
jgi:AcrR family transcriptional regulator